MQTHNFDYPRNGSDREPKKACKQFWSDKNSRKELVHGDSIGCIEDSQLEQESGVELIHSIDFLFYYQIVDTAPISSAILECCNETNLNQSYNKLDMYFVMDFGYQQTAWIVQHVKGKML